MSGGARRYLAGKYREVYLEFGRLRERVAGRSLQDGGVRPENMVWIFGAGRSGSTWLRSMMGGMPDSRVWEEPLVGRLFGNFYEAAPKSNLERPEFVLGDATRKGWTRSIRNFVLDGAMYARPRLGPDDYLIIKEPNGSVGAPLIMEALPESRMILLVRDPRDVVASVLDGARSGNWLREQMTQGGSKREPLADEKPEVFVRRRANTYLRDVGGARRAYDAHKGHKVLVRYEELLEDTQGTMKRVYSSLNLPVDDGELTRVVEKHSWKNIPEEDKGEGKFYRKGVAGGWKQDLTPGQARIVEQVTASLVEDLYPI